MDTGSVTRFEVIDETGRVLVRYGVDVELDLQDDGRTLKVFLKKSDDPYVADMKEWDEFIRKMRSPESMVAKMIVECLHEASEARVKRRAQAVQDLRQETGSEAEVPVV